VRQSTFQDVEADATQAVDIWMIDLGQESDLGRRHGVVVGQEKLEFEGAAFVGALRWAINLDVEVS